MSWSRAVKIGDELSYNLANLVGDTLGEFYKYTRISDDSVRLEMR